MTYRSSSLPWSLVLSQIRNPGQTKAEFVAAMKAENDAKREAGRAHRSV